MTPEMYFDIASDGRKRNSRQSRRLSAGDCAPIATTRFLMVPDDSSAARMPRPGATMASATLLSSARFIAFSVVFEIRVEFAANSRCWQRGDDQKCRPSFCPQHLYPWQGFALQPFEEGAAGGQYIGKPLGAHGRVYTRH